MAGEEEDDQLVADLSSDRPPSGFRDPWRLVMPAPAARPGSGRRDSHPNLLSQRDAVGHLPPGPGDVPGSAATRAPAPAG